MSRVIESLSQWKAWLEHEYPGVSFVESETNSPGLNAVTAGVLVGRYHTQRTPAYGVVFDQPRSCGGRY